MQEELKEKSNETSDTEGIINNQYINQLLDTKIAKYFSKDTSSKIALATALITLGSFLIRVLGYMRTKGYLSVFSMSIEYMDYSANHGFSAFLFESVIFIGLMVNTALSYLGINWLYSSHCLRKATYALRKPKFFEKVRRFVKDTVKYIPTGAMICLVKAVFNVLVWLFFAPAKTITLLGALHWLVVLLTLSVLESICATAILYADNKKRKVTKNKHKKTEQNATLKLRQPIIVDFALSIVILSVFMCSSIAYFSGIVDAHQTVTFPIIGEDYAIVYQSNDYYWTVKSAEKNNVLTINTGTQKVIPIAGLEIEKKTFSHVHITY